MVRLVVRRPVDVAQQSSVLRNSYDLASNERTFNRHESLEQKQSFLGAGEISSAAFTERFVAPLVM